MRVLLMVVLLLTACGEAPRGAGASRVVEGAGGRLAIGEARAYQRPGTVTDYAHSHGVFLVTHADMLVALTDRCVNPRHGGADDAGVRVTWDDTSGVFTCVVCGWTYDSNGLPQSGGGSERRTRSLARASLSPAGAVYEQPGTGAAGGSRPPSDDDTESLLDTELVVDPRFVFRQERQQWSAPGSYWALRAARAGSGN